MHNFLPQKELEIVREVAHAFLTASQPLEVYRLALARVTPLVQATFSSVFLRDGADPTLLRLVCAHNWPQASARYLSQLRIRVGRGPTGRAVEENEPVEVENLFSDPSVRDWWDPARELGFASMISLPLTVRGGVAGALSFYFEMPHHFEAEERRLLALVADQLAATVEKAHLIEDLQAANEKLQRQNAELTRRVRDAEEARRLKTEFLANVSHELRTPLTSILGYAYLLSSGHTPSAEQQRAALEKIERSATVLLGLINDLIELSQLKLGRAEIVTGAEQAVEIAERAIRATGSPPEGVELRVVAPDGPVAVQTDGDKVQKILTNLISNAFKFTSSGTVEVAVRRVEETGHTGGGDRVLWTVRDTGIGIRPEDLEAIFDEFRQVDGSSTRLYGGTGLGLALSLRIAQMLGGDIVVESEPGSGSTFTLWLPVVPPSRVTDTGPV